MLRALAFCVVLVGMVPATAAAEWQFTPLVGLTFKGVTNIVDVEQAAGKVHKNLGGAVTLLGDGIIGVEALGVWMPAFFQSDQGPIREAVGTGRAVALMGNVVLTTPRLWTEFSLRPYVSGGAGLMSATVTQLETAAGSVFPPERMNAAGFNVGGGAIGFFSERTGVRFDFRYYSTFRRSADPFAVEDDSSYLRYMTASVGIVFRRR